MTDEEECACTVCGLPTNVRTSKLIDTRSKVWPGGTCSQVCARVAYRAPRRQRVLRRRV